MRFYDLSVPRITRKRRWPIARRVVCTAAALAATLAAAGSCSAGLRITPLFGSTITSDPNAAIIESTINAAIGVYEKSFTNNISVSIAFGEMSSGLGQSSTYYNTISYQQYRSALAANALSAAAKAAVASLPSQTGNPVDGSASVDLTTANLRALGFSFETPPTGQPDSTIDFNESIVNNSRTSINPNNYDLQAVISHEIDEALGFGSALNGLANGAVTPTGAVWAEDLFRYSAAGVRSFSTSLSAKAYFSYNGGTTDLANFNQNAGGDFSDWSTGATPLVQEAFGTPGAIINPSVELTALNVLGYQTKVPEPAALSLLLGGLGLLLPVKSRPRLR